MEKYIKRIVPRFIFDAVNNNPELKKIITNMNWLFFDKVIQMAVSFFVGVWVIRYLGPEKYGTLSYAVAFVGLFGFIAKLGMDGIVVREFIDKPNKKSEILGTSFFLRLIAGISAFIFSLVAIFFVRQGDVLIFWLVFIIALGFVFQISDVVDFWFQSQVKSKHTVYVRSFVSMTLGLIKILLILSKAPLIAFAWVILFDSVMTLAGFIIVFLKNNNEIFLPKIEFSIGKNILTDSWPLILASVAVSVYMKIDQVMIGNMLGAKSLGIYSAAVSLSEVWYFFPIILTASVFPAILYTKKVNKKLYMERLQMLYDVMVWVSIAIALLVTFFSKDIINLLFGREYAQSASVLAIYVWAGIAVFLGVASEKFLIAENLTMVSFMRTALGGALNVLLNLYLIPRYGILGSAWATLISYFLSTFSIFFSRKASDNFFMFFGTLNLFRIFKNYAKIFR